MRWVRFRTEAAAWIAATFAALAAGAVAGRFLPSDGDGSLFLWLRKLQIAILVLFPYFLWRFSLTFVPRRLWFWYVAHGLGLGLIAWAFLLTDIPAAGEPRPRSYVFFVATFGAYWMLLSLRVAVRLWLRARGTTSVTRKRMRTLALGSLVLGLLFVTAGAGADAGSAVQAVIQLMAICSGFLFLAGFAPPSFLRNWWRQPEEAGLNEAILELVKVIDPQDIPRLVLPRVRALVSGTAAVWLSGGRLVAADGAVHPADQELSARVLSASPGITESAHETLVVEEIRGDRIGVIAPSTTAYFGLDEFRLIQRLLAVAEIALERADLLSQSLEMQRQLVEAQEIAGLGSWEWDLASNTVIWSDQMYRIYGVNRQDVQLGPDTATELTHPADRERVQQKAQQAIATGRGFSSEYRILRPDGSVRMAHGRGKVITARDGTPVRMIGTVQDITARKEQEEFRDRFISNAAHELRTPLTSLVGFTETLAAHWERLSEDRIKMAFEAITRSNERLVGLVNNLLDLSKLQQEGLTLTPEEVDLDQFLSDLVHDNPPPEDKNVALQVEADAHAWVDRRRLDQVVTNLLTNAYRYGGPNITVSASNASGHVNVAVVDDGPGVEPEVQGSLWDPFVRGQRSSEVGGSGLGLAIVRMLVEASGGTVTYQDEKPHGGRFEVRLRAHP